MDPPEFVDEKEDEMVSEMDIMDEYNGPSMNQNALSIVKFNREFEPNFGNFRDFSDIAMRVVDLNS